MDRLSSHLVRPIELISTNKPGFEYRYGRLTLVGIVEANPNKDLFAFLVEARETGKEKHTVLCKMNQSVIFEFMEEGSYVVEPPNLY